MVEDEDAAGTGHLGDEALGLRVIDPAHLVIVVEIGDPRVVPDKAEPVAVEPEPVVAAPEPVPAEPESEPPVEIVALVRTTLRVRANSDARR